MLEKNELYPLFLKVAELHILIVGGGNVGLEKLTFLLKSSPSARVLMVSKDFIPEIRSLAEAHDVDLILGPYKKDYLANRQIVIATTDNLDVNLQVYKDCKEANILVNLADNPLYCDFYMGGIVTKGNVVTEILAETQARGIDLIVMGYHSRGKLEEAVVGSTTRRVLRQSKIPVLLVRLPMTNSDISKA